MLRRNKGQALVLLALALFVLLGFAALAVDVGYMYTVRNELQRCADSGALAGASAFFDGPSSDTSVQTLADTRARDFASSDDVATSPLNRVTEIGVRFDVGPDRIRVDTQRNVNLFFARVLGSDNATITAYAVAQAAEVSQNVRCIAPWGIPLPWTDVGDDEPNGTFDADDLGPHQPEENCDDDWAITVYDQATHAIVGDPSQRDDYLCSGSLIVLKIGKPQETLEPGHFLALDFSSVVESCPEGVDINSGASFYKYMIKNPCKCGTKLSLNEPVPIDLKTGDVVGPTIHAIAPDDPSYDYKGSADEDSLMSEDPDAVWNYETNLPDSPDPRYNGKNWQQSPRVVRIPLYDPQFPPSQGKDSITPIGFAGFWVQDVLVGDQGTVLGRFIPASAFGESPGPDAGPSGAPTLKILRLVE